MADFGYKTQGGISHSLSDGTTNKIRAGKFQISEVGTADSITVYLESNNVGAVNAKCAIYETDWDLVDETEELSVAGGYDNWKTFNFPAPKQSLDANTDYWLCAWAADSESGKRILIFFAADSAQYSHKTENYDGWPNPLTDMLGPYDYKMSIYCTYTPGGAPPGIASRRLLVGVGL